MHGLCSWQPDEWPVFVACVVCPSALCSEAFFSCFVCATFFLHRLFSFPVFRNPNSGSLSPSNQAPSSLVRCIKAGRCSRFKAELHLRYAGSNENKVAFLGTGTTTQGRNRSLWELFGCTRSKNGATRQTMSFLENGPACREGRAVARQSTVSLVLELSSLTSETSGKGSQSCGT